MYRWPMNMRVAECEEILVLNSSEGLNIPWRAVTLGFPYLSGTLFFWPSPHNYVLSLYGRDPVTQRREHVG
jgi:hypothetical protein